MCAPELSFRLGESGASRPPRVSAPPLLGSLLPFKANPMEFFERAYREHGPLFRISLGPKKFVVLCGVEANRLVMRREREFLSSEGMYDAMSRLVKGDPTRLTPNTDGKRHQELRAAHGPAFTRTSYEARLTSACEAIASSLDTLGRSHGLEASEFCKRLLFHQISRVCLDMSLGDYYEDVQILTDTLVRTVTRPWANYLPAPLRFRRAFGRLQCLWDDVAEKYYPLDENEVPRTFLDFHLRFALDYRANRSGSTVSLLMPFAGGLNTLGAALAFNLYAIAKDPKVQDRLAAEVDENLTTEPLTATSLRTLRHVRAAMLEALRLYPVVPGVPRHLKSDVEIGGYQLRKNEKVFLPFALPHLMPEFFPRPELFDLDRFEEKRAAGGSGAFVPFGIGAHACLGSGLSEACLQTTVATILRQFRLELDPPDYQLRVRWNPGALPDGMRLKLIPR